MRAWLLSLMLVPTVAFAQDDDPGILTRFLQDNLSGAGRTVVVSGFQGALSSRATIRQLTIADAGGVWLTLNGVVLDWNRMAVLRGQFSVNTLTADEIVVARLPVAEEGLPSAEARGFALPELPISVDIGRVAATRVELGQPVLGEAVAVSLEASLQLAGGEGRADLALIRTDDGPEGAVTLQGSYSNATRVLALDLDAREGAGGIVATRANLPGRPAAELKVSGTGPIDDYRADIRLATDGAERLAGAVELISDPDGDRRFVAALGGNPAPLFLPDYAEFFGDDVRLDLAGSRAATGALTIDRLAVAAKAMQIDGSLLIASDGLPERFALTGRVAHADGSAVLLPIAGAGKTFVDRAEISLSYDSALEEGWSGMATLSNLDRTDFRAGQALLSGSGRIARGPQGNLGGATVRLLAADLTPADPGLDAALGGAITAVMRLVVQEGRPLSLSELTLAGGNYTITTRGRIDGLDSGLRLTGTAEADIADLGPFSALAGRPLGGRIGLQASGSGSPLGGDFDLEAEVQGTGLRLGQPELDTLLQGASRINVSARRGADGTDLRRLEIAAATLSATAQGTLRSTGSDLTGEVAFRDLGALGPRYRGSLAGKLRLTGTPAVGSAMLDATADGLALGQAQADALLRGRSSLAVAVRTNGDSVLVDRARLANPQLTADVRGLLRATGSDLTAEVALADLGALGAGFRGTLAGKARLTGTPEAGSLTLDAQGDNLAVGQAQADALLRGRSTLSAALRTEGGTIRVERAALSNPQLTATATGQAAGADRRVEVQAKLANLGLILPEFPGALTVAGTVVQDGQGFRVDLAGRGPGQIDARVAGRVAANAATADLAITGSAQAALADAFIAPQTVSGPVTFDLRLNGRPSLASLSGRAGLAGGRVSIPSLPFSLQGVDARADLAGGRAQIAASAGVSSGGNLAVSGTVGMTAPFPGDLAVQLRDVVLRDPQLYEVTAVGDLRVTGPLQGGARIAGRIDLPAVELRVPSTGLGESGAIPDLTHLNEPPPVRATRARAGLIGGPDGNGRPGLSRPYVLDVTISAPNQVFLRGRGLDAELGGTVRITGTSDAVVPSGAIDLIRGRLDILGRRLDLNEAQLQLSGSLDPTIRLVASNSSGGITSSVVIDGQISAPEVSFTSSPELPEEEVLAHLLFGRDLTSLSALQAAQLANAVAVLAGRGGEGVISRLRKGFGLDDLDLVTDDNGGTSVRVGKYISKKVYTEVVVGSDGTSQLNLNLDVRPGVTLRGSADTEGQTGIGVFVEKDY